MDLNQFPFSQVAAWLAEGSIVPFLGAGASQIGVAALQRLPDGQTLAHELIEQMGGAFPSDGKEELAKVAQFYERSVFDRPALYDYLKMRFVVGQQNAPISQVARLIASVPNLSRPLFVITTNYDTQIERAMHDGGRPLCIITQNMRDPEHGASRVDVTYPDGAMLQEEASSFQWNDPAHVPDPNTIYLFKMHGSLNVRVSEASDDIIITEDDYVDFLVNSGGPVTPFFPPPSLAAAYKTKRFLFMGYSLADWNFRAFLRLLALRNTLSGRDQRRHWAIQLDPDPVDEYLWRQRNVNLYRGDLSDFCVKLEASWIRGGAP